MLAQGFTKSHHAKIDGATRPIEGRDEAADYSGF